MGRLRRAYFVLIVLTIALSSPSHGATPDQINQVITKAKAYLFAQQKPDKTWEQEIDHGDQKTGPTALCVYALLVSGESRQDPRLSAAIEYLKKTETTGVYALGLRCQLWLLLPPTPDVRAVMSKDARLLVQSMIRSGDGKGFYDYNLGGKNYSHSRAQYGVLGLWAASQMGIEVPRDYWQIVEKAWIDDQDPSGGWAYLAKPTDRFPLTPGMTAVGVATLFITQDFLHAAEGLNCAGNIRNPSIDRGMKWMADNFDKVATDEKYPRALPYSTLYAIERIGVASGHKYFGDIDWYEKGADWLVKQQKSDGSFPYEFSGLNTATTSLAILFMTRGSAPVLMNKLDYSAAGAPSATESTAAAKDAGAKPQAGDDDPHWNQRPRDVANLARWVGRQVERDLNWQIVNLNAPVADWHDAPILYISGNQSLNFSAEHEAKIKQFVEQGGIVLGNADCSSTNFVGAFRALGKKLFPAYDFAPLPDNHVIYTNQQFARSKWKRKPNVLALGNGAREFMILLPDGDPARAWQTQNPGLREEAFQLAADIFLYAVDKQNLRRRGEGFLVNADEKIKPAKTIKLARIQYAGNWNPEPGGWQRLSAVMHNSNKVTLTAEPVTLEAGKLDGYSIAHLTGTGEIKLDPIARKELKKFIQKGGRLIIDAAGGSSEFATSIEAELAAIFPEAQAQVSEMLPASDPLFSAGGTKLESFGYRTYARSKLGQLKGPQLRGMKVEGRLAIIYSREDLSVGLVGQPVDGIIGYDPETATALMTKAILVGDSVKK